ncbi:nonstructural protein nsp1a [Caprine astrovirus]|nr:nonstructural protein nsp1a [Caprine astrovirus]
MSLFLNRADEAIASGDQTQLKARFDARDWFDELRRINPTVPWYITYQPRMYFYPTLRSDRVLTASTVDEDEWRTFVLTTKGCEHIAEEVNHIPDHQATILAAALMNDRINRKRELSDLKLENQILRAELAQHRNEQATATRFVLNWPTIFALVFLGFSLFWHSAQAMTTTSTTDSTDPMGMLRLNIWLDDFIRNAKNTIHTHHTTVVGIIQSSPTWIMVNLVMPYMWTLVVICLGLISVYKSEQRVLSLLFLCASSLSGGDWLMLSTASAQTIPSAIAQVLCVLISHVDPLGSLCLSAVIMGVTFLTSMCMSNVNFIQHSRASAINTVTLLISVMLRTLKLPALPIACSLALVRAYTIMTSTSGSTIEIRSEDGKVVAKEPARPGVLFRFKQALRRFGQVRSNIAPLVRVNPSAVVRIETPDGIGTGFACANYIVTAGHVVGTHKAVSISVGKAKYQSTLARHIDGKDVALLKMPPQLQGMPRLKIASKVETEWVCVYSPDEEGAIVQSVVPGHQIDECINYAVPTRDGMSGAPIVNPDGRVMAVHLTNTGYTGGAVILTLQDVTDPPKSNPTEDKLKAEIEELRKQLAACSQSSTSEQDIVNLVRVAIGREMSILRSEINRELGFSQAKGKMKGKNRQKMMGAKKRKQRGPVFTEEEYQKLIDEGLTSDQIRDMVDDLYKKEEAGYPDWEPLDDGYDPEDDWVFESDYDFGQKRTVIPSFKQYLAREYDTNEVEEMLRSLTPSDIEALGPVYHVLVKNASGPLCSPLICVADRYAAASGLAPPSFGMRYTQRRVPSKNGQRGPRQRAQKSTN